MRHEFRIIDQQGAFVEVCKKDENEGIRIPLELGWLGMEDLTSYQQPSEQFSWSQPGAFYRFFFFLSLLERLTTSELDEHERWSAPRPDHFWPDRRRAFLDEAVDLFMEKLGSKYSEIPVHSNYSPTLSVDIDQWYAYRHKGLIRSLFGIAKDVCTRRWQRIMERWEVVVRGKKDPYDQLVFMEQQASAHGVSVECFVLPNTQSPEDRQVRIPKSEIKARLANYRTVGLHPSYHVHDNTELLIEEKREWEGVFGAHPEQYRFHYLRGRFPVSQLMMIKEGFSKDKSLCLSGDIGFPNGTCHPFPMYNHQRDEIEELLFFPQMAMDVTLKNYLKYTPNDALMNLKAIVDQCKYHKGTCSIIWHNSSFDTSEDWTDYIDVFSSILELMKED